MSSPLKRMLFFKDLRNGFLKLLVATFAAVCMFSFYMNYIILTEDPKDTCLHYCKYSDRDFEGLEVAAMGLRKQLRKEEWETNYWKQENNRLSENLDECVLGANMFLQQRTIEYLNVLKSMENELQTCEKRLKDVIEE